MNQWGNKASRSLIIDMTYYELFPVVTIIYPEQQLAQKHTVTLSAIIHTQTDPTQLEHWLYKRSSWIESDKILFKTFQSYPGILLKC